MKYFILILLSLTGCSMECTEYKTILGIGGCDKNGRCGVMFSDGSVGSAYYPVALDRVCTKREFK